ncbi:unnamed protein product (macronuclear) [Paramecium tetraurelia]|uniref:Uncharacterized protein n=1 Tax=Paramecium tetraurelia TaxID=5888 RepID=A0E232_PARTE|nr:uncharacterized protein GSPATT00022520001 [Paramecium tetraurelia]CAK89349.1 unnamed protein product [Paramecium tetraurelia]|eukprot:XP_001456746.1 hypothetical protein (macronuclear) [Paramecium tetraurelia strain d4-2]
MSAKFEVIKYMLIGSNEVGKTAFLTRSCENNFDSKYEESKGMDFKSKMIEDDKYKLCIFDTPGSEKLRFASYGFYKSAFGFILIFDLTRPYTLADLKEDMTKIVMHAPQNVEYILVGNKSDQSDHHYYQESQEEAQKMANQLHIPYFEISCMTGQNVDLVIEDLTKRVLVQMKSGKLSLSSANQAQNHLRDERIKAEGGCCCKIY